MYAASAVSFVFRFQFLEFEFELQLHEYECQVSQLHNSQHKPFPHGKKQHIFKSVGNESENDLLKAKAK